MTTEPIPGWEQENVFTYQDVLRDESASLGHRVLIVDEQGERTSPGLAELLASRGHEVTVITRWPSLSTKWLSAFAEVGLTYGNLDALRVNVTPNAWLAGISGTQATCYNVFSGRRWEQAADSIVLVTMKYSSNALHALLRRSPVAELHQIGDAVAPRWIAEAVQEGARVAYAL